MRILPDIYFKDNYKKRYNENFEKINAKHEAFVEARQNRKPDNPDVIKYKIVGFVASVVIIGSYFAVGYAISTSFREKENYINQLYVSMNTTDSLIKSYQIINGDAMHEQVDKAVRQIVDLQNQYISQDFSDNFDVYADRYLGSYSNNWAVDCDNLSQPIWHGYINKAVSSEDSVNFVFILYDSHIPILVADVDYSLDDNGNLGTMTGVRKMRLL